MSHNFSAADLRAAAVLVFTVARSFDFLWRRLFFIDRSLLANVANHPPAADGIEGMMGGIGTVFGYGKGKTKIFYHGEIWEAVIKERISPGEQVEIIGFDRMKLVVRRQV